MLQGCDAMADAPLEEQLLHRVEDGVAWITFNRPDAANSITPAQRDRFTDLLHQASGNLTVRAVVVTANGKHFCTGADLRADRPPQSDRPEGSPERPTLYPTRMIATG